MHKNTATKHKNPLDTIERVLTIETNCLACKARQLENRLSQCFQSSGKTTLVASSLVFMNYFLVSNAVNRRYGRLENSGCSGFIAGLNRFANSFNCRAQRRALAGILSVQFYCL